MALRGVDVLLDELEKAKTGLKDVDKTIARLTGRDPTEPSPRGRPRASPRVPDDGRGRGRIFASARRSITEEDMGPPIKRRSVGGAFSRLGPRVVASRVDSNYGLDSGEEDQLADKPAVQSSVVATGVINRTREDATESLSKDKESKGRNRRMFGALLGTLQRFKAEEKTKEDKEKMRKAVEDKLEQKARKEVVEARKERRKLFEERQKKEQKIKSLEQKMELVKIHEQWASQTQVLGNFIRTKAKPHLYYIPKQHVSATKDRLKQTKELLEKVIKDRRKALEEEIAELTKEEEEMDEEEEEADKSLNTSRHSAHGDREPQDGDGEADLGDMGDLEGLGTEGEGMDLSVENKENVEGGEEDREGEVETGGATGEAEGEMQEAVRDVQENGVQEGQAAEGGEAPETSKETEVAPGGGDVDGQGEVAMEEELPKAKSRSHRTRSRDDDSHHKSRRDSGGRTRRDSRGKRDRSGEQPRRSSRHTSGDKSHEEPAQSSSLDGKGEEGDNRTVVSGEGTTDRTVESRDNVDTRQVQEAEQAKDTEMDQS